MLFPYIYVPHQMEKMQAFIDFIFHEVWCKAPASKSYSLELFKSNPELHEVMTAFHYDDSKGAEFFAGHVERIYGLFVGLSDARIDQFRQWYCANNDIEKVCANDPATSVTRYADFPVELKEVRDQLKSFFKDVYSHLDLATLKAKIGDIDDHYQTFASTNKAGKCPFCGIGDIKGAHHSKRDAYDHFLPKALYPFNSINFRNLVPACHECNSTYKLSKDPAHNPAGRRKAFNPYAAELHVVQIQITLQHADVDKLAPADITMHFGPTELVEELDTWNDVYSIEERYKAKLCGENDGKYWLTQVLDEWKEDDRDPADFLATLARLASRKPYADCNFLRKPFLDACHQIGIFEASDTNC
jgi:5-methylcytosine-specific restriction endonuclease McrA